MWTHIAATEEAIAYQVYPRLLALAEVAWTPQPMRDWSDFSSGVHTHYSRLQSVGINYCDVAAPGKKLGTWQGSDLAGEAPRQFTWEATLFFPSSGEAQLQVRRDRPPGCPTPAQVSASKATWAYSTELLDSADAFIDGQLIPVYRQLELSRNPRAKDAAGISGCTVAGHTGTMSARGLAHPGDGGLGSAWLKTCPGRRSI